MPTACGFRPALSHVAPLALRSSPSYGALWSFSVRKQLLFVEAVSWLRRRGRGHALQRRRTLSQPAVGTALPSPEHMPRLPLCASHPGQTAEEPAVGEAWQGSMVVVGETPSSLTFQKP